MEVEADAAEEEEEEEAGAEGCFVPVRRTTGRDEGAPAVRRAESSRQVRRAPSVPPTVRPARPAARGERFEGIVGGIGLVERRALWCAVVRNSYCPKNG